MVGFKFIHSFNRSPVSIPCQGQQSSLLTVVHGTCSLVVPGAYIRLPNSEAAHEDQEDDPLTEPNIVAAMAATSSTTAWQQEVEVQQGLTFADCVRGETGFGIKRFGKSANLLDGNKGHKVRNRGRERGGTLVSGDDHPREGVT